MQKVLIIEDETVMRNMLNKFISRLGIDVFESDNADDGMTLIQTVTPDLVILDLMMQGTEGDKVLEYVRQTPQLQNLPVIVTSAHPKAEQIAELKGANACLKSRLTLGHCVVYSINS